MRVLAKILKNLGFPVLDAPTRRRAGREFTSKVIPILSFALALVLFWAPLPFGSVLPGAVAILRIAAAFALIVTAIDSKRRSHLRPTGVAALAIAGIAVLGLLQSARWPEGMIAVVSPVHAAAFESAEALAGVEELKPALSLAPEASRATAWSFLAVAALFVAAGLVGRSSKWRRAPVVALVAAALFQVLAGARWRFSGGTEIWGVTVPAVAGRLRGTFVNPDHLAVFLEIGLAVVFGWVWWTVRRSGMVGNLERKITLLAPSVMVWLTLFVGLAFTGSRAGLLAAVIGTAVQGVLIAAYRKRWHLVPIGVLAAIGGTATVMTVGAQAGLGRLLATSIYEVGWNVRLAAYSASLRLWGDSLWIGTGLGTFREAFPRVQSTSMANETWVHAHNDLLELAVTTGVVGLLLFAVALFFTLRRLKRVLFDASRSEGRAAAIAAFGALTSVGIHELLDFGLTIPANAFALTVVVGMACGAHLRR